MRKIGPPARAKSDAIKQPFANQFKCRLQPAMVTIISTLLVVVHITITIIISKYTNNNWMVWKAKKYVRTTLAENQGDIKAGKTSWEVQVYMLNVVYAHHKTMLMHKFFDKTLLATLKF